MLTQNDDVTLQDMLALQTDHLSVRARRVIGQLDGLSADDPTVATALDLLRTWDFVESTNSPAAAIWEVWWRRYLGEALVRAMLASPEAVDAVGSGDSDILTALIEKPDQRLGADPVAARNEILLSSLQEAVADLTGTLGPDVSAWRWGDLHHAVMEHPLSPVVDASLQAELNVGPAPRGGSGDTVGNTGYRLSDFRQTGGASFRMVLDIGEWDRTLAMNTPGQSGDPNSPHYRDLFPLWAADQAFPLLYQREQIEAVVEQRILLTPPT